VGIADFDWALAAEGRSQTIAAARALLTARMSIPSQRMIECVDAE
jgi:hypothetical protein